MRAAAHRLARLEAMQAGEDVAVASLEAMQATLHELHVHQIELEMQNGALQEAHEALQEAKDALEVSRKRYFELYDLAPVGYLTIAEDGLIKEANLTLASLLGLARAEVVGRRISQVIHHGDQDVYYHLQRSLMATGEPQVSELRLMKQGHGPFRAHLEASLNRDPEGRCLFYVVVSKAKANISQNSVK